MSVKSKVAGCPRLIYQPEISLAHWAQGFYFMGKSWLPGTTGEKLLVLYSAFPSLPNLVSPTLPQGVIITLKLYNKMHMCVCVCIYSLLIQSRFHRDIQKTRALPG